MTGVVIRPRRARPLGAEAERSFGRGDDPTAGRPPVAS